jgi:hypothetical protein
MGADTAGRKDVSIRDSRMGADTAGRTDVSIRGSRMGYRLTSGGDRVDAEKVAVANIDSGPQRLKPY